MANQEAMSSKPRGKSVGLGFILGTGIGIAICSAIDATTGQWGIGLGLGVAVGITLGLVYDLRK